MICKLDRKVLFRCCTAGGLFLLSAIFCVSQKMYIVRMDELFLEVFGGVDNVAFESILLTILQKGSPMIFFLYLFSTFFQQDFLISYVYVFTRINKRQKWLNRKVFSLCTQLFFALFLAFALVYLCGSLFGLEYKINIPYLIRLFLTNYFVIVSLSFLQNCLSLWCGATKSFFILLFFYAISLVVGILTLQNPAFTQFGFYLLLPINGMYLWHEGAFYAHEYQVSLSIQGFAFWKSYLACLLWLGFTYTITLFKMKRCDLLDIEK